jgi:SPP1 gp7 family putative phage head morphogenesis protein
VLNERAARTVALIRAHAMLNRPARRQRLPRPAEPALIWREYGEALGGLVKPAVFRRAFAELLLELPSLMASARRERGDAAPSLAQARVYAWLARAGVRADADEGRRARALVAQARERLRASVSTRAIEELAEKFAENTSTFQRIQLGRQTRAVLGADVFTHDKGLRARVQGFATENVSLIKGITDDVAGKVERAVTRALTSATLHDDLAKELEKSFGYGETRAALIARDQIGKFYGQINASRQQALGLDKFVWRTVGDERVREDHAERDGEVYSYSDPPDGELPGEPILCRCYAEPALDELLAEVDG